MPGDPVSQLLERLRGQRGMPIATSALGRLRRTASAGARMGFGVIAGRLRGGELNLGSLSPEALASLVESLGELKGLAMKAGQILSYVDGSLSPEARNLLSVLQVNAQPADFSVIDQVVREDLGSRSNVLLEHMQREPVSTASIGQVHRARLTDGTELAVKVRQPGIDVAIRADFKTAALGKLLSQIIIPGANVAELMQEAEARFLEECDYALEAERQARFAAMYAGHASIAIPQVHFDWCGPRVLSSTWHTGLGFEAFLALPLDAAARERAARSLYEFYVGTLYRQRIFNADPHPGNLLFAHDGRVTVLDHGCAREFEAETVAALIRLSRAVRRDNAEHIQAALGDLGMPEPQKHFDVTRSLLRGFYRPLLTAGAHPVAADRGAQLAEAVALKGTLLRLRLPGKLAFLFRIRFGLHAVLARIGAVLDWAALEEELTEPRDAP